MKYNFGDEILLKLEDKELKGRYVPSRDNKYITLKLESGYNINVKKSEIKDSKLISKSKKEKKNPKKVEQDKDLPLIYVLHAGGTIASKVNYKTGGVSAQIDPSELLNAIPEIKNLCRIKTKVLFNLLSENIRFEHFNIFAETIIDILKEENVSGFILAHGTDTLHYTTSALSFILQNIKVPIVVVGSQRSSDRPSTDSNLNLLNAVKFILDKKEMTGVFASMHGTSNDDYGLIYKGTNLRKMHTSRRDAFEQINTLPVAQVFKDKIEYFEREEKEISPLFEPAFFKKNIKVGIFRTYPNMFADVLEPYKDYEGLIIEGTGLGHISMVGNDNITKENENIHKKLKELSKNMPIVMTSQCIKGRTDLDVYSVGRLLKETGVLAASSLTTETAYIKLAWLLSNFSKKETKNLWNRNFIGEILKKDFYK